jgi:SAM-dependent methyltransferase
MRILRTFADSSNRASYSHKFRLKRFQYFINFLEGLPRPVKILDAGGTQNFWEKMKFTSPDKAEITILNNELITVTLPNFRYIWGDIRRMNMFRNNQFDVVFSNSVIEHLASFDDMKEAAGEIIRTGKKYFVQTPNYYFPIEPHFLFPFFQFLPKKIKIFLLMKFKLGWFEKQKEIENAEKIINSVNLLTKSELLKLFPGSCLLKEQYLFITKSLIVHS